MNIPKALDALARLHRFLADPEEGSKTWSLCVAVAFSDLEIALSQRVVIESVLSPPGPFGASQPYCPKVKPWTGKK